MKLIKGYKILTLIVIVSLMLTGCTDNRHLKDLAIVEGIAIDRQGDEISLHLQTLNVGISNSSETPQGNMTINTADKGKSLNSAIVNISASLSKRIFFGQNKLIILGRGLADKDFKKELDYLLRSTDSRADIAVCMASDKAEDIIKSKENDTAVPCENMLYLINNSEKSGLSVLVTASDLLNIYNDKTSDLFLPVLKIEKGEKSVSTDGIALFSGNSLSYITSREETQGFVLLIGDINNMIIEVEDSKLGRIGLKLSRIKCKKRASIINKHVVLSAKITGDMLINEIENGIDITLDKQDHERIKKLADQKLCLLMSNAFLACKRAKSDSIRLGEQLACNDTDAYRTMSNSWNDEFLKAEIAAQSDISVKKISDNTQVE